MAVRSVSIDSGKLKEEFKKRNLSVMEVAETLGITPNSLSKNLTKRRLSKMSVAGLQRIFNIDMDDIVVANEEVEVVEENEEKDGIPVTNINVVVDFEDFYNKHSTDIENRLHRIIYSAVYEAVKKAWAE